MANLTSVHVTNGIPDTGTGDVLTLDGVFGARTDDKNAATDTTSVSGISLWKQCSEYLKTIAQQVSGTFSFNVGAADATSQRVVIADMGSGHYEAVAAGATDQVLGATGAIGDWLDHVNIYPASTAPGTVTIKDGSNTIGTFTGGVAATTSNVPFSIDFRVSSKSGAFTITTGSDVSALGVGRFT